MADTRPQTLTCRPDPVKYPDLVATLTGQMKAAGYSSMNAYLADLLAGLVTPAVEREQALQTTIDDLRTQLTAANERAAVAETANEILNRQAGDVNGLQDQVRRLQTTTGTQLATLQNEVAQLKTDNEQLTLSKRRIIDLAVKNSFVSRSKYEAL